MPRRETRKPLQSGRVRRIVDQVHDDPNDKRTWSEEQRWDGAKYPNEVSRIVEKASDWKLVKMRTYFRRIGDRKKQRLVEAEQDRRK